MIAIHGKHVSANRRDFSIVAAQRFQLVAATIAVPLSESLYPYHIYSSIMSKIFTLYGKGLKLDTRADMEPYLKDVPTTIEEIHLGGNTIGIEAAQTIAEFLTKTTALKVRTPKHIARAHAQR